MDTVPANTASRFVDQLEQHLDQLAGDPTTPTDDRLFDQVGLHLTGANIPPLIPRLLPKIIDILKQYQSQPDALCQLAIRLLRPLDFHQVLSFTSQEGIILALQSPASPVNLLAVAILAKAAKSPGDTSLLATMKDVITSFVTLWLSAPWVDVGELATEVLGDLLMVDSPDWPIEGLDESSHEPIRILPTTPGQGFMWRRIFHDRDVYGLVLSLCSDGPHQSALGRPNHQQLSLAQGRLLSLLPRLSVYNLGALTKTHFPDLHQQYMNSEAPDGLLYFAAIHMVDKEDSLMLSLLIDFVERLIKIQLVTPPSKFKTDTFRNLYRTMVQNDDRVENLIKTLPDCAETENVDELRQFIYDITND
ncbi:hypothetical protein ANO14919_134060 [Xylariales sp. No.14919]|nr:hypothetical protein ANO14919_134060 [Xylariales sp. No.14919]